MLETGAATSPDGNAPAKQGHRPCVSTLTPHGHSGFQTEGKGLAEPCSQWACKYLRNDQNYSKQTLTPGSLKKQLITSNIYY